MIDENRLSSYLDDLPAIYREESSGGRPDFLGRFLLAFEHVLTGVGDREQPGLEEILEGIVTESGNMALAGAHRYFTPGPDQDNAFESAAFERAPKEFLEWLSGWTALTLRDDWDENERRRMLAEIVPSYRQRGTPDGLKRVLTAFTKLPPDAITISELLQPFQLGVSSTLGQDVVLGSGLPHYFKVRVRVEGPADLIRKRKTLQAIIDMEKPAHTYYRLIFQIPTMQVGVTKEGRPALESTLGKNTVLGIPGEHP